MAAKYYRFFDDTEIKDRVMFKVSKLWNLHSSSSTLIIDVFLDPNLWFNETWLQTQNRASDKKSRDQNEQGGARRRVVCIAAVSWGHFVALPLCVLGQFSRITSAVMSLGRHHQTCSRGDRGRVLWAGWKGFQRGPRTKMTKEKQHSPYIGL